MPHPNVALVQKMYECFGKGDLATIRQELFTPDMVWRVPGRHPLAGTLRGIDEFLAFLGELGKTGVKVEPIRIDAWGDDMVVEVHHGYGEVAGVKLDVYPSCHFRIKNGRIADVQEYQSDQYAVDNFFCAAFQLAPLPDRLARK